MQFNNKAILSLGKISYEVYLSHGIIIELFNEFCSEFGLNHDIQYSEYCKMILDSEVLLDLNQKGQTALTLRVMEAMFFGKKLITNNTEVKNWIASQTIIF